MADANSKFTRFTSMIERQLHNKKLRAVLIAAAVGAVLSPGLAMVSMGWAIAISIPVDQICNSLGIYSDGSLTADLLGILVASAVGAAMAGLPVAFWQFLMNGANNEK